MHTPQLLWSRRTLRLRLTLPAYLLDSSAVGQFPPAEWTVPILCKHGPLQVGAAVQHVLLCRSWRRLCSALPQQWWTEGRPSPASCLQAS